MPAAHCSCRYNCDASRFKLGHVGIGVCAAYGGRMYRTDLKHLDEASRRHWVQTHLEGATHDQLLAMADALDILLLVHWLSADDLREAIGCVVQGRPARIVPRPTLWTRLLRDDDCPWAGQERPKRGRLRRSCLKPRGSDSAFR